MDQLDKNLPDDFWRKMFEEAAETPPPRIWASIEQRLDKSDGPKVLPLWGTGLASSRSFRWGTGIAAALALLLVGWWAIPSDSVRQPVAQIRQANPVQHDVAANTSSKATTQAASPVDKNLQANTVSPAIRPSMKAIPQANPSGDLPTDLQHSEEMVAQTLTKSLNRINIQDIPLPLIPTPVAPQTSASFASNNSGRSRSMASFSTVGNTNAQMNAANEQAVFDVLSGKPLRMRRPGMIQRIVWVQPAELTLKPEENKVKHQPRELWASVSMMPGAFNPSVSLRGAQPSFASNTIANTAMSNQASVSSRANFSVAYQAGAGVQLTERWSVESGIGYLSGRSTVEAPGQQYSASAQQDFLTTRNSGNTNAYVDALKNSIHRGNLASSAASLSYANSPAVNSQAYSAYDGQSLQTISNNYQYVQVPVQVGYQIRPRKRLSMAVLGGLLTNIFVRNTVGDAVVVTSKDGVYRPVSFAATMGARLRYRPSRQWSASLAGVYQPSLESSTQADSQVQSHPTSAGMSVGVDYHF